MKVTKSQLKQIIKEELEEVFDIGESESNYFIDIWGVMNDEDARQRYNDYVLSQGEYENDGLLDPMNQSLVPDFIKWMREHPNVFEKELATRNPVETVVDYAAHMSSRKSGSDSDPDTNDDGMLSVGELVKMTQDIAADVRADKPQQIPETWLRILGDCLEEQNNPPAKLPEQDVFDKLQGVAHWLQKSQRDTQPSNVQKAAGVILEKIVLPVALGNKTYDEAKTLFNTLIESIKRAYPDDSDVERD